MRQFLPFLCCLLLTFIVLNSAHAQDKRTISVTGEAEVRVAPDRVIVSMTSETRGQTLLEAKTQNDQAVAAFIDYARKTLDVDQKFIQTDFVSVQPIYRHCNYQDELKGTCSPLDISYYSVKKGVQVKLNKLEHYETLVTQALELGITHIDNVQFVTTELRKHRDRARVMAAQAAQEKARDLTNALGMDVGKPVTINANHFSVYYPWRNSRGGAQSRMMQNAVQDLSAGNGSADSFAIGQISITAKLDVVFEIK